MDEDWHASCPGMFQGIGGEEWGRLCNKNVEVHTVNIRKPGNNHKTKALWVLRDAKTNGEAYYDRSSERQMVSGTSVGPALWNAHKQSPTAALEEAFRRTEEGTGMAPSSLAAGSQA